MSIDKVLQERGGNYGDFRTHAQITQSIKAIFKASPKWEEMNHSQKEALEMIAHKLGRILNGRPNYKDSWTDIAGYARLVEKEIESAEAMLAGMDALGEP